ncbi:helix-turn-helix domain-containing protein [Heyndrickxia sporothermodurans]|uniref:helix-turn-helix domain-containing protein n=1 Tax=Heyndrickxia sporothermodurans TaxID=46224 RepID=UPI002E247608|nr:helix-turn-helix domain-containing protein [Heyndrickxia sporothermodurans]MED3697922.1 helix-turn-helix domain-containing protein [Heyndrickxia sporothermodurans]
MHYLANYQSFNSTQELNDAIYTHIKRNTFELNETDRLTLKTIARYAVKFAGAAHLKAATLAELIAKSEKTARRVLNKLATLGIVKKVATTRKVNGGKGANIIVIQPPPLNDQSSMSSRQVDETLTESNAKPTKIENEPSDSINLKNLTLLDTAIPSQALKDMLPSEIYSAMSPYFNAEELYKYYGVLLRAKRSINRNVIIEDNAEPYVTSFLNAILKTKQGKIRKLDDYLYRAWQKATEVIVRRQSAGKRGIFYDWLND